MSPGTLTCCRACGAAARHDSGLCCRCIGRLPSTLQEDLDRCIGSGSPLLTARVYPLAVKVAGEALRREQDAHRQEVSRQRRRAAKAGWGELYFGRIP